MSKIKVGDTVKILVDAHDVSAGSIGKVTSRDLRGSKFYVKFDEHERYCLTEDLELVTDTPKTYAFSYIIHRKSAPNNPVISQIIEGVTREQITEFAAVYCERIHKIEYLSFKNSAGLMTYIKGDDISMIQLNN